MISIGPADLNARVTATVDGEQIAGTLAGWSHMESPRVDIRRDDGVVVANVDAKRVVLWDESA